MIGHRVSHYRLTERIGHGASGSVYKAEDLTLKRTVAIKVIKPSHQDPKVASKRFIREAQAISQIDHPNVVTVFEVLQEGATNYLVMQYVKGGSLRQIVERGPLDPRTALGIARDVAAGLEAAHALGVVHRDIKPENVIVEPSGRAKVLDFGVARLVDRSTLTGKGRIVGTLPYMAPEQIKGDVVDPRTDVYALGVVLCEMLTGKRPFESGEEAVLFYQIVNVPPKPLGALAGGLPDGVEAIVAKALEKDPTRRYASTSELRHDLEIVLDRLKTPSDESQRLFARRRHRLRASAWTGVFVLAAVAVAVWRLTGFHPAGRVTPPRIMVTRANNSLGNPDVDYLSGGMMDGLITALGQLEGFNVVSRQTVASAEKGLDVSAAGVSARENWFGVAEEVGADYIVTGSFARSGDVVRMSCELNEVSGGVLTGSWSEDLTDLETEFFSAIDRFASEIALTLGASWKRDAETGRAADIALTSSLEALKHFERGMEAFEAGNVPRVVEHMRAAVEYDPEFTAAYLWLAQSSPEPDERKAALEDAMKYRHKCPEVLKRMVEAEYLVENDQIDGAIQAYESVLAADPEQVTARAALASLLVRTRRFEEAVAEYAILKRVTPVDYSYYPPWWIAYFEIGREDKASAILLEWRRRLKYEPAPLIQLVLINGVQGKWDECLAYCDTLIAMSPAAAHHRGHALMHLGRLAEAETIFQHMVSDPDRFFASGRGYTYLAEVSYLRGEYEVGLSLMEKALSVTGDFYNCWVAGRLAAGRRDFTRAEEYARRIGALFDATKEDSTTAEAFAYRRFYCHLVGEIALSRRDFPRAIEMFEASLKFSMRVDSPFFRTCLGQAYFDSGDYARAIEEFDRVLSINPKCPLALFYLGKTYVGLKNEGKAKNTLGKLADVWANADADYPLKMELDRLLAALDHS